MPNPRQSDPESNPRSPGGSQRLGVFFIARRNLTSNPTLPLPSPSRPQGSGSLGIAMVVLFSPLLAVAGLSLQTLLRVVPQAAEGKDFFPKDTMDF